MEYHSALPVVSFIIVARNASEHLSGLLLDFLNQDYPENLAELILVDSASEDGTRNIMEEFASNHEKRSVRVLSNEKLILSSGWNVALAEAKGDIVIRVDAHSRIPQDFIRTNVAAILKGEHIVGGQRITEVPKGLWAGILALAEESRFGSGKAAFRNPGPPRYVDTLAHAAYRRNVFKTVGGYDERLVRTEDNEIHYRMKRAGFKFFYDPEIHSFHVPRTSLRSLLKQKYGNGLWIGLTLGISPKCFGLRHFVPAFFVSAIVASILFSTWLTWLPLIILGVAYFLSAAYFSMKSFGAAPDNLGKACPLLPIVFFLMHAAYGVGTWVGLLGMLPFVYRNRNYKVPYPVK